MWSWKPESEQRAIAGFLKKERPHHSGLISQWLLVEKAEGAPTTNMDTLHSLSSCESVFLLLLLNAPSKFEMILKLPHFISYCVLVCSSFVWFSASFLMLMHVIYQSSLKEAFMKIIQCSLSLL